MLPGVCSVHTSEELWPDVCCLRALLHKQPRLFIVCMCEGVSLSVCVRVSVCLYICVQVCERQREREKQRERERERKQERE